MEREVLIPLSPKDDKHKLLFALSYIKELKILLDKAEAEIKSNDEELQRTKKELKAIQDPGHRTKKENMELKRDTMITQLNNQILKLQQENKRIRTDNRDLINKLVTKTDK